MLKCKNKDPKCVLAQRAGEPVRTLAEYPTAHSFLSFAGYVPKMKIKQSKQTRMTGGEKRKAIEAL